MSLFEEKPIYQALALPNEALSNGGVEILRAGIINDELFVTARRAFKNPAQWGEVLADIARRVALLYSAEDTDLTEKEIIAEIEEAFAAEMGAPVIKQTLEGKTAKAKTARGKTAKPKARAAKRGASKKAARPVAKRKKR